MEVQSTFAPLVTDTEPALAANRHPLQERIDLLTKKLQMLNMQLIDRRKYSHLADVQERKFSRSCSLICSKLADQEKRLQCLKACQPPSVPWVEVEQNYRHEFPLDLQRLNADAELKDQFLRHQMAASTIEDNPREAEIVADLYSMPISVFTIPDESWHQSFVVITNPQHSAQLAKLVQNWKDRKSVYTEEASDELAKNIRRFDHDQTVMNAIRDAAPLEEIQSE